MCGLAYSHSLETDCPHLNNVPLTTPEQFNGKTKEPCEECKVAGNNSVCLTCAKAFCSGPDHIGAHCNKQKHPLALNSKDSFFFCYECKSEVNCVRLNPIAKIFGIPLAIEYTAENVIERIKSGNIKKVAVMVGAGLSVSAGIPDFRSPGEGIYSKLKEYNLPSPESIFELGFFKKNPKAFYSVMQSMAKKYYPTKGHYFLRLLQDKGILLKVYTQNIDGLEIEAGVKQENCMQAHGTIARSHCVSCKTEVSSDLMAQHIVKGEVLYCPRCKGPCKPDVVLFGESLPISFFVQSHMIAQADLVIVIGTSLKITPFADLINRADSRVPRLIIDKVEPNKISSGHDKRNIMMLGEADETLEKLIGMLGWNTEFNDLLKEREELIKKYEDAKAKGVAKPF